MTLQNDFTGVCGRHPRVRSPRSMKVGVLDVLTDTPVRSWVERLYATYFRRQFMSIMPQAVAVWCRQLGHKVTYATYCGQRDPLQLLPDDLDVVFISSYTQASSLAYALGKVFRSRGTMAVLGGPHARSFPSDVLRFFDFAVLDCDKTLVDDLVNGRFASPAVVTSGRSAPDIPLVEERMPDIITAGFVRGRPVVSSLIPVLASVGCPYTCNFCIDWNTRHVPVPEARLEADLRYVSENWPGIVVGFHDPNFGVRFDETMEILERIPAERRNGYIMESSLAILKEARLPRLRQTRCVYTAPGVESWGDYSNKAGVGAERGRNKLDRVVEHFEILNGFVDGLQANFLFGADIDSGNEPVELTREFIRRLPQVWPTINIPTPFGGTPLHETYVAEGRILTTMPFAFYHNPYLSITLKHYDPLTYYDHLIALYEETVSSAMLGRRMLTRSRPAVRFIHALRTFATRSELGELRRIRSHLARDVEFRAYHEREHHLLPGFYHRRFEERMGRLAKLIPPHERIPYHASVEVTGGKSASSFPRVPAEKQDALVGT